MLILRDLRKDLGVLNDFLEREVGEIVPENEPNKKEVFNYILSLIYQKHPQIPEMYVRKWDTDDVNDVLWHLSNYGVGDE